MAKVKMRTWDQPLKTDDEHIETLDRIKWEIEFKCELCSQGFKRKHNLTNHKRNKICQNRKETLGKSIIAKKTSEKKNIEM